MDLELPPMSASEAALWEEGKAIQALAYYCRRIEIPFQYAWDHFNGV